METKKCNGCNLDLVANKFHKKADGLQPYCKLCRKKFYPYIKKRRVCLAGFKFCRRCKTELPVDAFHKTAHAKDGRVPACKPCTAIIAAATYLRVRNRPGYKARSKAYYATNKDKIIIRTRWTRVLREYGLSRESYEILLEGQDGRCWICRQPETAKAKGGLVKHLAVDHSHATGMVRGLLCEFCNKGLGFFGDNASRLTRAAEYVTREL